MANKEKIALIKKIVARELLDSRGNPTLEVEIQANQDQARAMVPSGASTGKYEALELRDKQQPFFGKGVTKAVCNVNTTIQKLLLNKNVCDQTALDTLMITRDGTSNKSVLGANAMLGVSLASARLSAKVNQLPLYQYIKQLASVSSINLPMPYANVINGGSHAEGKPAIQEFMIVPTGARSFREATQIVCEVYQTLKGVLKRKYGSRTVMVGDEGGFAPHIAEIYEVMAVLEEALQESGHKKKVQYALDAAASEFYQQHNNMYRLEREMTPDQLIDFYAQLVKDYPIISLEDPFDQDDFASFTRLREVLNKQQKAKLQIVADDLTVTNTIRIKRAVDENAANCLLLKVNQIGTLTEAIAAAKLALRSKWKVMVSHRSGETEDPFIADLAVGVGAYGLKAGSPSQEVRRVKYERLLEIEKEMEK